MIRKFFDGMFSGTTTINAPKTVGGPIYLRRLTITNNITSPNHRLSVTTDGGQSIAGSLEQVIVPGFIERNNISKLMPAPSGTPNYDFQVIYNGGTIPSGQWIEFEVEYETSE